MDGPVDGLWVEEGMYALNKISEVQVSSSWSYPFLGCSLECKNICSDLSRTFIPLSIRKFKTLYKFKELKHEVHAKWMEMDVP